MHSTQTMASVVVACRSPLALVVLVVVFTGAAAGSSKSFNITNSCSYTVWPAISSGASSSSPDTTGFELAPGQWEIVSVPSGWSGSVWGRTFCSSSTAADSSGNKFTCVTGDCGSGRQDCAGGNAAPPVTLAEFTLDGSGGMDTYNVSLVDGFNLPLLVAPQGGNCAPTGCMADLNAACPAELRVTVTGAVACKSACLAFGSPQYCCTGAVACKSACMAFRSPQYCCTGEYGNPDKCKPSAYSQLFKNVCPKAYSYAYDGASSTFTCGGGDTTGTGTYYSITFCPSTTSGKHYTNPSSGAAETGNLPLINGGSTTTYTGAGSQVGGEKTDSAPCHGIALVGAVLGVVSAVLGLIKVICFS